MVMQKAMVCLVREVITSQGGGRIVRTSEINEEGDDCCGRASGNANLMMLHIV